MSDDGAKASDSWVVDETSDGAALAAFVRERLGGRPWKAVKELIGSGKVFVAGARVTDDGHRVHTGDLVVLRVRAPRVRDERNEVRIVHEDSQVVVIDKPAGVSSVPYERGETGTALDLIRDAWRRQKRPATDQALHVVHRIDKDTSGLLVFAKTKKAERELAMQFRAHTVGRTYTCVAHGSVASGRIESRLVDDRGDGLRGSVRVGDHGKTAVTHVRVLRPLQGATLCEVRLETGKTHQIRIHLAERGHPLVGERVYVRDYEGHGNRTLPSPRLLLHAATLGFVHPVTHESVSFESALPEDFQAVLRRLER
jgi:23S rRNA pseudouridine1911/1915/1917 synthase